VRISEIVLRFVMQIGVTTALIAGYMMLHSANSEAGLILMLPFFLGIPGLLVILLIFLPVEVAAIRWAKRWVALVLHPVIGAAVPWLLYPIAGNTQNFLNGAQMLTPLGLMWGILWSATALVYVAFRKNTSSVSS
jgi:hypothetical protein